MKIKKRSMLLYALFLSGAFMFSCKEETIGQQPIDKVAPGPVSNVKVENTAGGAKLSYTLPGDEDLLYVKAVYSRRAGEISESRTSLYRDTLRVEGFGDMQPHEVKVIAVDRSRNESSPVTVTIQPLEPDVIAIGRSLALKEDFGGIRAVWENKNRAEISVVVLRENNNVMEYLPIETFYSSVVNGSGSIIGMDTIPGKFGTFVQDHWANRSEVKYYELSPYYETLFDRTKFRDATLPGDGPHATGGNAWSMPSSMWDGIWGNNSGYSTAGGLGVWPQSIALDMGVLGKVSRIRIMQRGQSYIFAAGALRYFEIYGCQTLDLSGSWDSWTKMMDCESVKPSGLPVGQNTAEDNYVGNNGEDFFNSSDNPKVRYLRIRVTRTWGGGDNFQIGEIQVFGDNR